MAYWLLKTEPDCYNWNDLVRDRKTTWDGVTNSLALKHIRTIKKGDEALIYHTGDQRAAVGTAKIISDAYANDDDEKLAVFDIKPIKMLPTPITLEMMKSDPKFAGWDLLRNSRLSVVPTSAEIWKYIGKLSNAT